MDIGIISAFFHSRVGYLCVFLFISAESVDKERDHEDLQLFEGEKKIRGKAQKPSLFTHSWG